MASSPVKSNTSHPIRSISFPLKSHPIIIRVELQLQRLMSSEATSSSSSSSICHDLQCLKDLYDYVDGLLQLPVAYQAIAHERDGKWVDDVLDGSLRLLDVCGTTRDVLLKMKEKVQDLPSSFRRRRRCRELDLANKVSSYFSTRKNLKKVIHRCMGDLKSMERKGDDIVAILSILKQVEEVTVSVFKSLLSFIISCSKTQTRYYHLYVISILMQMVGSKHEGEDLNEVGKVDAALHLLGFPKLCKGITAVQVKNSQDRLEALDIIIQCLEDRLECLFRSMIKSRVSLLNILNRR